MKGLPAVVFLLLSATVQAQETAPPPLAGEEVEKNPTSPCLEPAPMVRLEDYEGPLAKAVGAFARKLETKTVHPPHYKPKTLLCSLEPRAKFMLFLQDTMDPSSFLVSGFNAGLDHVTNQDPSFGQGARGYAKRFGADLAGQTAGRFFGDFLYPTLFSEDPRYYRMAHGSGKARFLHAVRHTVIAHRDDGALMFNYTEWLGTASSLALNNLYHPDNRPGLAAAVQNGAFSILQDMGFDVLREFWPEIARAFKLPFRGMRDEK
jgi:hypothetical protein